VSWLLLLAPAAVAGWVAIADVTTDSVTIGAARGTLVVACGFVAAFSTGLISIAAGSARPVQTPRSIEKWPRDVGRFLAAPHLLFKHTRHSDGDYGHVAAAGLAAPDTARAIADLSCERVSFGGDRGICIQRVDGFPVRYNAVVFDQALRALGTLPLEGTPSRSRTSVDGKFGATTMFLGAGTHSYATVKVSTKTTLFEMQSIKAIADLEAFAAFRNGARFRAADFNYWGVTFSSPDSNTFYATLRTGTTNYLVRGDIAGRRADVVAEDIECPSLSPNGRRIAFKRREGQGLSEWRLYVLELATLRTARIEAASSYVDDQVEWLDDENVLYALSHLGSSDIWIAPVDGGGRAQVLVHDGESPIVVRTAPAAPSSTR
jgi:WD40-like Beta Propeller Repeat